MQLSSNMSLHSAGFPEVESESGSIQNSACLATTNAEADCGLVLVMAHCLIYVFLTDKC